jgi:hypothetical protein
MASGEMTEAEFTGFLTQVFRAAAEVSRDGALHYICNGLASSVRGPLRRQSRLLLIPEFMDLEQGQGRQATVQSV